MQGAEIEDDGSVLKYMTKSEIEKQRSSLLIMTQRHGFNTPASNCCMSIITNLFAPLCVGCSKLTLLSNLEKHRYMADYNCFTMLFPVLSILMMTLSVTAR